MQLSQIPMYKLTNRQMYTLGMRVQEVIVGYDKDALGITLYANRFLSDLTVYRTAFDKDTVSAGEIAVKDGLQDDYYIVLRQHIGNFLFHPDPEKQTKAKMLVDILNKEGKMVYRLDYKSETATLSSIFQIIDANHLPDLEALGAMEWYNLLKSASADFEQTISKVADKVSESKKKGSASEHRSNLVESIRKLFAFLPLHYEMTESAELGEMLEKLERIAERFKSIRKPSKGNL